MVGSNDNSYQKYFAQSPGQGNSLKTKATDKARPITLSTNGKSKSSCHSTGTSTSSVDLNGNTKHTVPTRGKAGPSRSSKDPAAEPASGTKSPFRDNVLLDNRGSKANRMSKSMDPSLGVKGNAITKKTSTSSQALLNKKKEIVDKIMVEVFTPLFNQWLNQACRPRAHGCDGHDRTSTGSNRSNTSDRGSGAAQRPPSGQKRRLRKDDQDDRTEEDDDDNNDGRRGRGRGKRSRTDEEESKKGLLACPYFKHNQEKYKAVRTCCGPGWKNVHRLKEHVYRKHARPEHICNRCCEVFKNDDGLKEHQRSKTPCPLKTEKLHDGFNKAQEKQLKSRPRSGANEIQKWEDMYKILFPEDPVPSPYYDGQFSEDPGTEGGDKSQYAKLENFLRQKLPPMIRSKLEEEVERELNCVEDIMKDKAVQIFQNTTLQLLQLARGSLQEATNSVPGVDAEPGPSESAVPSSFDTSVLGDPDLGELFSSDFTFESFYNFPLGQAGFEDGVADLAYDPITDGCSRDSYGRCPATECEPLRTRKTHAPVFT